jgi:hypothetical protein
MRAHPLEMSPSTGREPPPIRRRTGDARGLRMDPRIPWCSRRGPTSTVPIPACRTARGIGAMLRPGADYTARITPHNAGGLGVRRAGDRWGHSTAPPSPPSFPLWPTSTPFHGPLSYRTRPLELAPHHLTVAKSAFSTRRTPELSVRYSHQKGAPRASGVSPESFRWSSKRCAPCVSDCALPNAAR